MTLNINQFAQSPIRGETDLQIAKSGIISGIISANQATALKAGDEVELDGAITVAGMPQFIAALYTDNAFGYMIYDPKGATESTPETIQVACRYTGPAIYLLAGATIAPGALVEQVNPNTGYDVQTLASGKLRGIALDYATVGQLTRVILTGSVS